MNLGLLHPAELLRTLRDKGLAGQLSRGASGAFILRISSVVLGFATNVLLARSLGASGYGAWAFALVWVNLLVLPATLGFNKLLVRDIAVAAGKAHWPMIRGLLRTANAVVLPVALLLAGGIVAATVILADRLDPIYIAPMRAAALLLPLMALVRLRTSSMVALKRVVTGHMPEWLLRPVLFLTFLIVAVFAAEQALTPVRAMLLNVTAMGIAFVVGAVLLHLALPDQVRGVAPQYRLRTWLASALPFALLASLQLLNTRIDVVMLGAMAGPEPVGMYNVAMQGATLLLFGLSAINMAVSPVLARLWSEGNLPRMQKIVTRSARAITLFSLPLAAGLCLFATEFLWLFGEEFTQARLVLILLVVTQFINVLFGSVGVLLTMTGHEKLAAVGAGVATLVNIALNWLLIPRYGMEGAAIASLVTMTLWNLLFAWWIYRRLSLVPSVIGGARRAAA